MSQNPTLPTDPRDISETYTEPSGIRWQAFDRPEPTITLEALQGPAPKQIESVLILNNRGRCSLLGLCTGPSGLEIILNGTIDADRFETFEWFEIIEIVETTGTPDDPVTRTYRADILAIINDRPEIFQGVIRMVIGEPPAHR